MAKKDINLIDIDKAKNKVEEKAIKVANFQEILDAMPDLDIKKKALWREIYENALEDRNNSSMLYTSVLMEILSSPAANHAIMGANAVKYIERMSRANDQILQLATMLLKETNVPLTADDIYSQIGKAEK